MDTGDPDIIPIENAESVPVESLNSLPLSEKETFPSKLSESGATETLIHSMLTLIAAPTVSRFPEQIGATKKRNMPAFFDDFDEARAFPCTLCGKKLISLFHLRRHKTQFHECEHTLSYS